MGWTTPSTCFPSEPWTRVPSEVGEGLTDPRAVYAERETEALRSADRWRARFDNLARLRMGVGLALITAIVAYLIAPGAQMPLIAVSVAPGQMMFTRISGASSLAMLFENIITPAFAAA